MGHLVMDEDDKDTPTETVRPLETSSERTPPGPPGGASPPSSSLSSSGVMGTFVRELRADGKAHKALLARLEQNTKAILAMLTARKPAPRLLWWLAGAVLSMALLNLLAALARQLWLAVR